MSASWSSITTLSGLTWEYPSTPSQSSPSSTARQRLALQTWAQSWCTAGTALIMSWVLDSCICWCDYAHVAVGSVPQCRGWPHGNVHCHWQHAATDQGQKHSQRSGFSQTYPHTTQLPGSDWGKKPNISASFFFFFPRLSDLAFSFTFPFLGSSYENMFIFKNI